MNFQKSTRYALFAAIEMARADSDEPVTAGPPGAAYRVGKFVRRHRR